MSPEAGLGLFCFANRTYAGPGATLVKAADALRKNGIWTAHPVEVSTAVRRAAEAVTAAYNAGRIEAASQLFSPNLLLDEPASERDPALHALKRELGPGRLAAIAPSHALAARIEIVCENGRLAAELSLTPGPAPRIQSLKLEATRPTPAPDSPP
jgi:hypothetical protein